MKKSLIAIIIAVILIVAGGLVLAFSLPQLLNSEIELTDSSYKLSEYDFSIADVTSLIVKDSNNNIEIAASKDRLIHIRCYDNDYYVYEVELENGCLSINKTKTGEWYDQVTINEPITILDKTLRIELPENLILSDASVESSNADISIKLLTALNDVEITNSNGELCLENTAAGSLNITTSNSEISVNSYACGGDLVINSSNTEIELMSVSSKGAIEINGSNKDISISALSALQDIIIQNSNGEIELVDLTADGKIEVFNSNRDILIENIAAGEITLENSNGNIEGTLSGSISDYAISSHVSNGDNNLPDGTNGRIKLNVTCSNADIEIGFNK